MRTLFTVLAKRTRKRGSDARELRIGQTPDCGYYLLANLLGEHYSHYEGFD